MSNSITSCAAPGGATCLGRRRLGRAWERIVGALAGAHGGSSALPQEVTARNPSRPASGSPCWTRGNRGGRVGLGGDLISLERRSIAQPVPRPTPCWPSPGFRNISCTVRPGSWRKPSESSADSLPGWRRPEAMWRSGWKKEAMPQAGDEIGDRRPPDRRPAQEARRGLDVGRLNRGDHAGRAAYSTVQPRRPGRQTPPLGVPPARRNDRRRHRSDSPG